MIAKPDSARTVARRLGSTIDKEIGGERHGFGSDTEAQYKTVDSV